MLGLIFTPGPIVEATATDLMYCPFVEAGLALMIASRRALKCIRDTNLLYPEEYEGTKKVLQAAAMTYVASAATALLQLLRLIFIANRRD